jgi:phage-related protein
MSERGTARPRDLVWVASSKRDLKEFPDEVQDVIGYALFLAQIGRKHDDARPLKGFGGAGVLEIRESFEGGTFRAVYTVTLNTAVYVLHAFQKKSRRGIATPKAENALVRQRLNAAQEYDARRVRERRGTAYE